MGYDGIALPLNEVVGSQSYDRNVQSICSVISLNSVVRACRVLFRICFVRFSDQICRSYIANVIGLASVLGLSTTYSEGKKSSFLLIFH